MKTIFFLLTLFPVLAFGCYPETVGILSAEVHGDTVILRDDSACRNCGAYYSMSISSTSNDTLVWIQNDIGIPTYCFCPFNLSVTVDSLKPGNYIAKVYYGKIGYYLYLAGYISFTITKPNSSLSPSLLGQYQSNCLTLGVLNNQALDDRSLKLFPNPTDGIINFNTSLSGEKLFRIINLDGKIIMEFISDKNENNIDLKDLPNNIYFLSVRNREKLVYAKLLKY